MTHPMPYGASERQRPTIPYLAGNADLLPMPLEDGRGELLPAIQEAPVIRIGPQLRPADAAVASIETRQARREPSRESDLVVPFGQAAITGVMVAIAVGVLSWAVGWSWRVTAVMFALSLVGAWFWRLRLMDSLLWTVETMTGQDLTGDNVVGRPAPVGFTLTNPATARATVAQETRQQAEDAERQQLQAFYDLCFLKGCSERKHGVKAGSGATRDAYIAQRDALFALGLAGWKGSGGNAGWELTVRNRQRAHAIIAKHTV